MTGYIIKFFLDMNFTVNYNFKISLIIENIGLSLFPSMALQYNIILDYT